MIDVGLGQLAAAEAKLAQMDHEEHTKGLVDLGRVIPLRSSKGRL